MTISRRGGIALAVLALLVIAAVAFHSKWFAWMGDYLVLDERPFPADMVVVLGGDFRGTRILKGAEIAWQGYAPTVLVSGAGSIYGQHESDLAIEWAVAHGYRPNLFIPFRYPAYNTRDEVRAVTKELRQRHARSFILVTSTYHTHRAASICRDEAPDMTFRVVAAPDRYFTPNGWWKSREGEKTFTLEWTKIITGWFGV